MSRKLTCSTPVSGGPTILVSMMHGVVAGVASLAPTIERDTVGANDVVGVRFTAPAVMVTK